MSTQSDESLDVEAELYAAALFDELYDAGCRLLGLGLPAIPVNGKKPCNASGNPAQKWHKAKPSADRLARGLRGACDPKRSFTTGKSPESEPGIGLRMGPGSCVDIEADTDDERAAVEHLWRGVEKPLTVSYTSSRGQHDLYRYDVRLAALGKDIFLYRTPDGKSVKIRVGGQKAGAQSVIPPSPGREWLSGCSFDEIEPAALPEVVIQRLVAQAEQQHPQKTARVKLSAGKSAKPAKPTERIQQDQPQGQSYSHSAVSDHVLGGPYESRPAEVVAAEIKQVFDSSVPTRFQARHEAIWALVRRLRAVPELGWITQDWLESDDGRAWLWSLLYDWFCRGKGFFRADFDECWNDFVEGWDEVKRPWGGDLQMFYDQSLAEPVPDDLARRLGIFDCENNRRLVSFCAVLQRAYGDKPFPLDGRAAAKVMGWNQTQVCRKLRFLRKIKILQRTFEGMRGRSAEYLYLPAITTSPEQTGASRGARLAAA